MPIYPALTLLIGSAISAGGRRVRAATGVLLVISTLLCVALIVLFVLVRRLPALGNISTALTQHPELYTLSMGHIRDLTLNAFAYLKLPLAIAAFAFGVTAVGIFGSRGNVKRVVLVTVTGMVLFVQAARVALVRFDSYLASYPLAQSLKQSPPGQLIEANSYYAFSSVFFYTGREVLLLNGRNNNLEYGSYAPGAPGVFIDDREFISMWRGPGRCYLLAYGAELPHLQRLVGQSDLRVVTENAGNYLLTNYALP